MRQLWHAHRAARTLRQMPSLEIQAQRPATPTHTGRSQTSRRKRTLYARPANRLGARNHVQETTTRKNGGIPIDHNRGTWIIACPDCGNLEHAQLRCNITRRGPVLTGMVLMEPITAHDCNRSPNEWID